MSVGPSLGERIAQAARLAAPIFAANDWKWGGIYNGKGTPLHVPSAEEIAQTIRMLYETATRSLAGSAASGRLYVAVSEDDGSVGVSVELGDLRDEVPSWEEDYATRALANHDEPCSSPVSGSAPSSKESK